MRVGVNRWFAAGAIGAATIFDAGAAPRAHVAVPSLSFAARLDAAEALERARFRHRIGANGTFEQLVPRSELERKLRDELRESVALSSRWKTRVTEDMLRAEIERMARDTRSPDRLGEFFDALGRDRVLVEECLARPIVVRRLARSAFENDAGIHRDTRRRAEALRDLLAAGSPAPAAGVRRTVGSRRPFRIPAVLTGPRPNVSLVETPRAFVVERVAGATDTSETVERYEFPKQSWGDWWAAHGPEFDPAAATTVAREARSLPTLSTAAPCAADDTWSNGSLDAIPAPRAVGSSVWTGDVMILWGGFSEIGRFDSGSIYDPATDSWRAMNREGAPEARDSQTTIWTGKEMIVWGGRVGENGLERPTNTGGRYDPLTDTWSPVSTMLAPTPRDAHTAVWTGQYMIVWGGHGELAAPTSSRADGGRYDPRTNTWAAISQFQAPTARQQHGAVWTGKEMIVWGGWNEQAVFRSGARYNPVSDSWTPLAMDGAPAARVNFSTVWTGHQMIVWGGAARSGDLFGTGGLFDPSTNQWTAILMVGAPAPRQRPDAAWTGQEMIVFGGVGAGGAFLGTGGRYDPATGKWKPLPSVGAPSGRIGGFSVWTGKEYIVWGGGGETQPLADGRRYHVSDDRWIGMSGADGPPGRFGHSATWTGDLILIWGGYVPGAIRPASDPPPNGTRFDPATATWSAMSDLNAPGPNLESSSVVWTGRELIVWGGVRGGTLVGRGWRYDPTFDTWTPTSTQGSPTSRTEHSAVWTGTEMIVWGGHAYDASTSPDGGRYDPTGDRWSPMASLDAPLARTQHVAVWTGTEMLVWGGWVSDNGLATTGAAFNPATNSWRIMSTTGAPEARQYFASAWTGRYLLVWGGFVLGGSSVLDTGARYDAALDQWTPISIAGAPTPRGQMPGVWNGAEFLVWGGSNGIAYGFFDSGGLYDPSNDSWRAAPASHAPEPRAGHSATWTGSYVFVWGGSRAWFLTSIPNLGGRLVTGLERDDDGDGYTECDGDCNDSNPSVHPGAMDTCNGLDDDCDGVADLGLADVDGDGVPACTDNCLTVPNPDASDFDRDGIGDACESGGVLADADNSGHVDGLDLAILGRAFASSPPSPAYDARADLTRDGKIDGDDLAFLATYWGNAPIR